MNESIKPILCALGVLASAVLSPSQLLAQSSSSSPSAATGTDTLRPYLEMLRSDFNTAKIATLNEVMKLTGPEADKFWPIYRNYEMDLAAVGDRKVALIREFAKLHSEKSLTDEKAKEMAKRWLTNKQDQLDLWKKYQKQISKAVSPIRAAQFLQVEHQLALFVDLMVASEMPLVGEASKTPK